MPLKKPEKVPKIPKARNKSLDQIKDAVPMKKEGDEIEYICRIFFSYSAKLKQQEYIISVETTKLFSMLNYELTISGSKNKKELDVSIKGLKTKQAYLTTAGPATGEAVFKDIYGEHTVNIIKQDGSINSAVYDFNVFKKEIKFIKEFIPEKKNNRKFCTFEIAEENFTFGREELR